MPRDGDVCLGTNAAHLSFVPAGVAVRTETTRRCQGAHHVAVCCLPDLPLAMTLPRSDGRTHTLPSCVLSVAHGCMGVLPQQAASASCAQRLHASIRKALPPCLPAAKHLPAAALPLLQLLLLLLLVCTLQRSQTVSAAPGSPSPLALVWPKSILYIMPAVPCTFRQQCPTPSAL